MATPTFARRNQVRADRIKILQTLAQEGDLRVGDFYEDLNGKCAGNDLKALELQGLVDANRYRAGNGRCVVVRYSISKKGQDFLATLEKIAA